MLEKIYCVCFVITYYLIILVKCLLIAAPFVIAFFVIDFIVWNKTKKSLWHKIKRTCKKAMYKLLEL